MDPIIWKSIFCSTLNEPNPTVRILLLGKRESTFKETVPSILDELRIRKYALTYYGNQNIKYTFLYNVIGYKGYQVDKEVAYSTVNIGEPSDHVSIYGIVPIGQIPKAAIYKSIRKGIRRTNLFSHESHAGVAAVWVL